ncbi:PPA1309 family protein [Brachybacterium alimentarium]|uniref:PPA1309 family protein n=1 Tax=Brachybacterium alimentarium TaxID=47845 RepID=UPI003FD0BA9C
MTTPETDPLDAPTAALAAAVLEISRHVDGQPLPVPRLYALARSAELMSASPSLAALLGVEGEGAEALDELHLTPIDLDDGSSAAGASDDAVDPLAALQVVQWPDLAAGGAIACEIAPSAWSLRAEDTEADLSTGRALRVVVAALADGTTWSAVHRGDENGYVLGAALLPDISAALLQTLQPEA